MTNLENNILKDIFENIERLKELCKSESYLEKDFLNHSYVDAVEHIKNKYQNIPIECAEISVGIANLAWLAHQMKKNILKKMDGRSVNVITEDMLNTLITYPIDKKALELKESESAMDIINYLYN